MAWEPPVLPGADRLFEEMPCGLLVTGVDGTILRVNHTFCTWVGLGADELVGRKKLQDLFTMGARIFHHTHWLPMLEMQGSISEVKFDVNGKGGAKIPMLLNVIRRRSGSGDYDQVSAVIAEERNKYESELVAARKRADASVLLEQDRSLFAEQMIGIVSHDLRNPLAVVMAATTVLERSGELTSEKSRRMLASIVRAGQRSRRLIEDLLDFTAARVGRGLVVDRQRADLHQIAGRAVEEMSVAFPDRKILQRAEGDGVVLADSDRLVQLLGNLIGNALTYGDPDDEVTVTSRVTETVARLSVQNRGVPIAEETLKTIFQPMVRGASDTTSSVRSVGLGLYIVRAIAVAHGGDVTVTSNENDGTEFVVSFPF